MASTTTGHVAAPAMAVSCQHGNDKNHNSNLPYAGLIRKAFFLEKSFWRVRFQSSTHENEMSLRMQKIQTPWIHFVDRPLYSRSHGLQEKEASRLGSSNNIIHQVPPVPDSA